MLDNTDFDQNQETVSVNCSGGLDSSFQESINYDQRSNHSSEVEKPKILSPVLNKSSNSLISDIELLKKQKNKLNAILKSMSVKDQIKFLKEVSGPKSSSKNSSKNHIKENELNIPPKIEHPLENSEVQNLENVKPEDHIFIEGMQLTIYILNNQLFKIF